MKQFNCIYTSNKEFIEYLHKNNVSLFNDKILIQMFTSLEDKNEVQKIASEVCAVLPNAKLVGCSSAGEIIHSKMIENSVVLSISIFEKTTIHTTYTNDKSSYELGVKVAKELLKDNTKCIISFVDGLFHDGEEYLNGFYKNNTKCTVITGGMAADLFKFKETFVIFDDQVYTRGAVGVALDGDELEVYNDYNLGWRAVGPTFTITKAKGNIVYEIDNKPVKEFYKEILGEEVVKNMPTSAIEFPLLKEENGITIARSVIQVLDDESIVYAGVFHDGDKVRVGLGSAQEVNKYKPKENINIYTDVFQAGFIYSCAGRKQFLSSELEKSFAVANSIAPTVGFFTYGEFYNTTDQAVLLNITTTLLFLFEKGTQSAFKSTEKKLQNNSDKSIRLTESATLHLVDYISKNLQQQQKEFNKTKFQFDEFLKVINSAVIISKTDPKGYITFANKRFQTISGYQEKELLGKSHNIIRNPETSKEVFRSLWETIKNGDVWQGILSNRAKDGSIYYVKTYIYPIFDQQHKIVEYMAIREDITDVIMAKKAFQDQLRFSNMLFDNEENIVIVVKNRQISKVNDTFFRTLGYKNLENFKSQHKCISDIFIEKEGYLKKEKEPNMWYDTILKEPDKIHFALMIDINGNERIYSVKARQIIVSDGVTYIVSTFNDITELEQAKQKAKKAEAVQSMFLANMSHEIRTPMNGILGFVELLQNTKLSSTQKKYIDIINTSTRTLLNIINDILDVSKITNNKIKLESININPFVELSTTFELLRSLAEEKSLIYINQLDTRMFECIVTRIIKNVAIMLLFQRAC